MKLHRSRLLQKIKENPMKEMMVTFIKKDKSLRNMKCVYGKRVEDSKGLNYDAESKGLVSVFDKDANGYRMINIATIMFLEIGEDQFEIVDNRRTDINK